ncbi:PLP-dependent aminotransferase family protein [Tsukamurella pseudospumae]|uniref:GntR family transcriptional regulator n=1 Tax=Tsukamurella pseudospumae TaxID=239498 RepID=A0A138AJY6_9ACTN|nr:PLP-dependent aminotransferase family protein [Tsukamurella pseudospumae]KXO90522.1 GntR family transcriptional regulator [Tsukamurella pseudospumae]KXP10821.1 GntR family transcriptional regulator [Tsukamurella pseudospumae]
MTRTAASGSLVLGEIAGATELVGAIVQRIADGALSDGDRLPSSRALAEQAGVSRGTVVRAFDELAAAGFIVAQHGSGTRISDGAAVAARAGARTRGVAPTPSTPDPAPRQGRSPRDLRPGIPDAALIDERAWRRAVRAAAGGMAGVNPWEEPSPTLVAALSGHLRRHRGIADAQPLLFDSSRSAVAALYAAFVDASPGRSAVVHIEDPGYRGALLMARDQGLDVRFHAADPDGLSTAALGDDPAIVFTTPAHQYPLGHRMSVERRVALAEWAGRTGSLVIEDDYDGEFRYGVAPLPALVTLPGAADHVAYVGTSSKSLAPDLRVAWCVPPAGLRRPVERWLAVHRRGPSALPADALGEYIRTGAMDRHLARAARVYSDRRMRLVTVLGEHCPELVVTGVEAGLHLCVLLPGHDDEAVVGALSERDWRTRSLSSQCAAEPVPGLVLSYARLHGRDADAFGASLREVLTGLALPTR